MNYEELGLRVGIEVHRQLDTERKLFCACSTRPKQDGREVEFVRTLREAQSELGEVDPAALFESRRRRRIIYRANLSDVCLVEMDEEPPRMINEEAVRIALTVSMLLGARPLDELHVMRKIVIDGSNTTGFQRTCMVAMGGSIRIDGKEIPIQTITLEEDAARIIESRPGSVIYDLTRLGVPLIEVSTAPVISSPSEAAKAAYAIGRVLRATRKVKRGIGTVRQDLNISISGCGLAEVKGVQELELIPKVVDYEVRRQLHLRRLIEMLRERGASRCAIATQEPVDVTEVFSSTSSKVIGNKLKAGGRVMALRLPRMSGLLGSLEFKDVRLGRELSEYAKAWAEVDGIFHSDELPGYGISEVEVRSVKERLNVEELDAFVLVADREEKARYALQVVRDRAAEAVERVPEETRAPRPDGTTSYMRPRPGSARMYPETDIPPLVITEQVLSEVRESLPPTLDQLAESIANRYGISRQLIEELIDLERIDEFERIAALGIAPSFVASFLTETYKQLKREGYLVDEVGPEKIEELFRLVANGETAKESAKEVLAYLSRNPTKTAREAIEELGLKTPPIEEVLETIDKLVKGHGLSSGKDPIGPLMGELMKVYRGRVDGAMLIQMLRERLKEYKDRAT